MSFKSIEDKYGVVISTPPVGPPTGISVIIPGTLICFIQDYNSTRDVLLSKNQLVIGFKQVNPFSLNPFQLFQKPHDEMVQAIVDVVKAVRALSDYASLPESTYNIVGHSLGGKLALMVAAKYKDDVGVIIAMDPVDDMPQELTYPKTPPKTNLTGTKAKIYLLQSEHGGDQFLFVPPQCPKDKNAATIEATYKNLDSALFSAKDSFFVNPGAKHMSYKDTEKDPASIEARTYAHELIRKYIGA